MGSFSFLYADRNTQQRNICPGDWFQLLVPKEFGGMAVMCHYEDYGRVSMDPKTLEDMYDLYELIAFWNAPKKVKYSGEFNPMKVIDDFTEGNRIVGINIGGGGIDIATL